MAFPSAAQAKGTVTRDSAARAAFLARAVLAVCLVTQTHAAAQLTEQERGGRQIYLQGESPSGARISARVGMNAVELSGAQVACGNCHGEDGRGRSEGGIEPPDVRWTQLTKTYGHRHANGRSHAAFDEQHLRRAVTQGIDPDGNRLDPAMPRYSMSAKDFSDLAAYIRKLEHVLDPGLTPDAIRIGTLLPLTGKLAPLGESLHGLWSAYFAALNERGGVHGRRLELVVQSLPAGGAEMPVRAKALIEDADVFALLAPVSAGIEGALSDAAALSKMPVVGPLTLFPEDVRASNPYVFHLLPGTAELARLLARHAARTLGLSPRPVALLHPDTPAGVATAQSVEAALENTGWRAVRPVPLRAGTSYDAHAAAMKSHDIATVLVLGSSVDLVAFAASAVRIGWTPHLLVPGPLAPRDIVHLPAAFADRVVLAYPSSPDDQRVAALREYAQFATDAATRPNQPLQISAYSAGLLLTEALKRAGRDLSRRKLVAALEAVQGFDTGLIPQVSYNADRRIGSMGGYLVALDLERKGLRPLGGYVRLQE